MGKKTKKSQQHSSPIENNNITNKSPPTPPSSQPQIINANGNSTITTSDNGNKKYQNNDISKKNSKKPNETEKISKSSKKTKKLKKSSGSNFLANFFSWKRLFLIYIFGVIFGCYDKKREECSELGEKFCFNGLSQYILRHDWFNKYVEPGVWFVRNNTVTYTHKAQDLIYPHYKEHAKPHVDVYIEKSRPHLENARDWTVENVYLPTKETVQRFYEQTEKFYNQHAKEHVDRYYREAKKFSTPYWIKAQSQAIVAYETSIKFNDEKIQPFYQKEVKPRLIKSRVELFRFYDNKVVPFARNFVEGSKDLINEKIIPAYREKVEPYVLELIRLVKEWYEKAMLKFAEIKDGSNNDIDAKRERIAKEKEEKAERKRKEEERRREAERKRKEEEERKRKVEKKRKEEERKREEELKRAEEAAIAAAIYVVNETIRESTKNLLPVLRKNLATLLKDYENGFIEAKVENEKRIDSKVSTFKNFCNDRISEIENIKIDDDNDVDDDDDDEKERIDSIKRILTNVNKQAHETIESTLSVLKTFTARLDELDESFRNGKSSQIEKTKTKIFETASDRKYINDELSNFVQREINVVSVETDEGFRKIKSGVDKVVIENKINSSRDKIEEWSREVLNLAKKVRSSILEDDKKQEKIETKPSKSAQGKIISSSSSSSSSSSKILIQSSDPIISALRRRYDPVLSKLKENYQKGNYQKDKETEENKTQDEDENEDGEEEYAEEEEIDDDDNDNVNDDDYDYDQTIEDSEDQEEESDQ